MGNPEPASDAEVRVVPYRLAESAHDELRADGMHLVRPERFVRETGALGFAWRRAERLVCRTGGG